MSYFRNLYNSFAVARGRQALVFASLAAALVVFSGCGKVVSHEHAETAAAIKTPLNAGDVERNGRDGEQQMLLDAFDRFAAGSGVNSLRRTALKSGQLEIRIWIGFSPEQTRGLVLRRSEGLLLAPVKRAAGTSGKSSVSPKNGWKEFWASLESSGILTLPEESLAGVMEPKDNPDVIVIETKQGNTYRTYMFEGLCYARSAEAQKLLEILTTVNESLNIEFFHCRQ